MKQFLILLSSITTLTISSLTFININQNTTFTNNLQTNTNNENQTVLFNNKYDYLSDSNWITNQSTIDHKFYSYNTSPLAPYHFAKARNVFLVDKTGNLTYNRSVTIPDIEKVNIENTKQEIISHKQITTTIDNYNPYSKSEYSNTYFSGNNNWQYVQFGGIEKHIDISQQPGANKVENSNNLSETLGLYYIAKAVHENKISQAIANNLGKYFINQSSLKENIKNNYLINNIISLIANNTDIFELISKLSVFNSDKNYAVIFIFDNKNKLIEITYKKFANNIIEKNINYNFNDWYSGFNSINEDSSNIHILLKWSNYIKDWDTFARVFSTFHFDKNSFFKVSASYGESNSAKLLSETKNIKTYQKNENNNSIFIINIDWGSWYIGNHIKVKFYIWYDNENIYFKWFLQEQSHWAYNLSVNIFLKNVLFEI